MFSYNNLKVYCKAFQVNQKVYRFLKVNKIIPIYARNQFGRACLSIMLNIAEGCAKFSDRDRRNYYVIARGSVFECTSLLNFLYEEGELDTNLKNELFATFEEISRMLYTLIKKLEK
jgi:four helix bundle protein